MTTELTPFGRVGGIELEAVAVDDLPLRLVVYRRALAAPGGEVSRAAAEEAARATGWQIGWSWPRGAAAERHCHTTTHEAVFVLHGTTRVRYGAAGDVEVELEAGDVVFHPAGLFHEGAGDSPDVETAGAYPAGAAGWDWHTGSLGAADLSRIRALPAPENPVVGGGVAGLKR